MSSKTPQPTGSQMSQEREARIREFILGAIDASAEHRPDAIAVLAHSPESPVTKAVMALSGELASRGMGATIILAGGAVAAANETWNLVFSASFSHEIRLTTNPRVLDGHEQLIVGERAVWFGDCMRRSPEKRDAFEKFVGDKPAEAQAARTTFGRLWKHAQPIYANASVASVSMARAAPDARTSAEGGTFGKPGETTANDILATLEAWQPSTRH